MFDTQVPNSIDNANWITLKFRSQIRTRKTKRRVAGKEGFSATKRWIGQVQILVSANVLISGLVGGIAVSEIDMEQLQL